MATEKRLIDANALKSFVCEFCNSINSDEPCEPADCRCMVLIDEHPTVDAVEVVRCEKCQYWNPRYETMGMCMKHNSIVTFTKPDFYCAWGKDKNDGIRKES